MGSRVDIKAIGNRLTAFEEAEQRSRELMSTVPQASIYVALCNARFAFDEFKFSNGTAVVRRVTNAPGMIAVCRAAKLSKSDYLAVGRYSGAIRGELALGLNRVMERPEDEEMLLDIAWHTVALVKLREHLMVMCPSYTTESWDVISAISDNRVEFTVLDDIPRQLGNGKLSSITLADMQWVDRVWDAALDLRDIGRSMRFGLAFRYAYTWNHTTDKRIALANLWCGIEALFGEKGAFVTKKLVENICKWLPTVPARKVEGAYNVRCDAVHGRRLGQKLQDALKCSEEILRASLIKCIETNAVPLPDWKP